MWFKKEQPTFAENRYEQEQRKLVEEQVVQQQKEERQKQIEKERKALEIRKQGPKLKFIDNGKLYNTESSQLIKCSVAGGDMYYPLFEWLYLTNKTKTFFTVTEITIHQHYTFDVLSQKRASEWMINGGIDIEQYTKYFELEEA